MGQTADSDLLGIPESGWRHLYRVGGIAALIAVIFFRRNCGAEMDAFNGFGIFTVPDLVPTSALEWFSLLQANTFVGMTLLGLVDVINYLLVGMIFLALFGALWDTNRVAMVFATLFGWVGAAVYFVANQAFGMLYLSEQYATTAKDSHRAILLAAGEALLVEDNPGMVQQGTAIYISLFLVLLAGLIISIVMLQSDGFNKGTAIVGLLANGLALGGFIALAVAPMIVWLFPTSAAPFRMIWYILVTVQLFKLSIDKNNREKIG